MPRSMLISRKRLIAAAGEQPVPMANAPLVNNASNFFDESHSSTTEGEEDEEDEIHTYRGDNHLQQTQPIQHQQQQQPPQDPLTMSGDQQVDSLTNAIIYFVSLFNQQQQQQQQHQIQQQPEPSPIEPPSVVPVRAPSQPIKREGNSRRSATCNQKQSQFINQLRKQKQQRQLVAVPKTKTTTTASVAAPAATTPTTTATPQPLKNEQQHNQDIFLNSEDLIDPRLSSQSQGKRSSSISGSGTDDNFVHYCVDCGKRYSTSSNLARHRQTHRDKTDKKAKTCPECDKVYVSMPAFSMHLRTHTQGCICSICGKSFSRPWLLQGHMRTHTGEKPFRCKICDKAFADKSNLRAHIQTHSTTKPFVCVRCNKAFALKSYLCKHVESTCMRASESTCTRSNESQKEPLNLKVLNHRRRNRSGQC